LFAATFLLQVAMFYWKFTWLIEDTKPSWGNLVSLGKARANFFEGGAWRNWRLPIGVAHRAREATRAADKAIADLSVTEHSAPCQLR
jgi:hypothetical protein